MDNKTGNGFTFETVDKKEVMKTLGTQYVGKYSEIVNSIKHMKDNQALVISSKKHNLPRLRSAVINLYKSGHIPKVIQRTLDDKLYVMLDDTI